LSIGSYPGEPETQAGAAQLPASSGPYWVTSRPRR
jgi:hypothetical protein